jgi:hypothetical protein
VNASLVFCLSLMVSLAVWLPTLLATLRGDQNLPTAGLRYLVALALARLAVGGLDRLLTGYRSAEPAPPPSVHRRRREDQASVAGGPPEG